MTQKKLKVTFICRSENLSGGQRVIAIYAERLTRRGHDVTVVVPKRAAPSVGTRARALLRHGNWLREESHREQSFLRNASFKVLRLAHSGPVTNRDLPDADVAIASWWETAEWVAALSAQKGAKVYFVQGHEIHDHLPVVRSRATYQLPLHKVVVAPWLKRVMTEHYGDSCVDVVPNSVDRSQFFAPSRSKQLTASVGFLYSETYLKGVDLTLEAIQLVRARLTDLRIISFGIRSPSARLTLPKGTEFHRSPAQSELRNLYARCDAWITASRSEGFNLTALEAMACRTPVVSTRTGWPQDAIKTRWNGFLVDINDVKELAYGIEWVLTRSEEHWRKLSANAYATASGGSWEESAKMFELALEHACRRARRGELVKQQTPEAKCILSKDQ